MLQPVETSNVPNAIHFRDIAKYQTGRGLCYVQDGRAKYTRAGKPFITLYLRDITGIVIPGYVFNLADFEYAGEELRKVINSLVDVEYEENYLPSIGMTVRLSSVKLLSDVSPDLLGKFVGSVEDIKKVYNQLMEDLFNLLGVKVRLNQRVCTQSHQEYSNGKMGGLVFHYARMLDILKSYAQMLSQEDAQLLYGCFVLFILAHSNYCRAEEEGKADITLHANLTTALSNIASELKMHEGAMEIASIFFGYEPKDIFVRLVTQASESVLRTQKEIAVWTALPLTMEGNAGYGTIRKYKNWEKK